ncbi:reticulocyte binding protein 1a, putative [Plasmodium ovale]|uniref:Reticulocyte binding protein 1a, putative n=1 Tax=Plasmodium ovale TaxID=36330 RepID=A0A1D3U798_PLAOA|nr:reticulocyte binding protein 1a, putative [Plasmodium ovale]
MKQFILVILFNLFICLGTSLGANILEDVEKNDEKVNFFTLGYNLKRNKKLKYNRGKKKYFKSPNFLSEKEYISKNNKVNDEGDTIPLSSNDISFVSINNYNNEKSSSYNVYLHRSNPHISKIAMNNISNSFLEYEEEELKHKLVIDNVNLEDNEANSLFYMEVDYVNLQYFNTILDLIPNDKPYRKYYYDQLKQEVEAYTEKLKNNINKSITAKNEYIKLQHEMKYGKKATEELKTEGEILQMIESKREKYQIYIHEYNLNLKPKINDIKNNAHRILKESFCTSNCHDSIVKYNDLLKSFTLNVDKYTVESHIYVTKSINNYASLDKILSISKALNIDIEETINSLKLLGEEIEDISNIYLINTTLIDDAVIILSTLNEEKESDFNAEHFENSSKKLVNNYCVFRYMSEFNTPIKKMYEDKIIDSNNKFSSVLDILEKKNETLIEEIFNSTESEKLRKESEEISTKAAELQQENYAILEALPNDHPEISHLLDDIWDIYYEQEACKEEIENKYDFISRKHKNSYVTIRENIESELYHIKQQKSNTVKANFLLEHINKINNEKKNVEENSVTIRNFYDKLKEHEENMKKLCVDFTSKHNEIKRLIYKNETGSSNKEEIKEKLEEMTKKIHYLKDVVRLKNKGNAYIMEMNELLDRGSHNNMDDYKSKRDAADSEINSLYASLHNDDINNIIKENEEFIIEKKSLDLEELSDVDIEQTLKEVTEKYNDMVSTDDNKLTDVLNEMGVKVTNAEKLKKEIVQKQIDNMYTKLSELFSKYESGLDILRRNMNEYEKEKKLLDTHKESVLAKEEEYFKNVTVDRNEHEKRQNQEDLVKLHGTVSKRKGEISENIRNMKEFISNIETYLNFYDVIEKYFNINDEKNKVKNVEILKEKINIKNMNAEINEYEGNFASKTAAIENLIKRVENLNKTISFLSTLNNGINECSSNNISIELLKSKEKSLREEVQREISLIEQDKIIEGQVPALILKNLKGKVSNIDEKLNKNAIENLDIKSKELSNLYLETKKTIHVKREEDASRDTLIQINEWDEIKKKITELNGNYDILTKNKDILFISNANTYIEAVDNLIKDSIEKIGFEKNEVLKGATEIEEKIKLIEANEEYKKIKSSENDQQIAAVKESVRKIKELVDKHLREMTQLESDANNLKTSAKEKEKDITHLAKTKGEMIKIYEKLKKIPGELNASTEIELKGGNESVYNVELTYEKKLVQDILGKIEGERNKAGKSMEEINSLKNKIEDVIKKTSDKTEEQVLKEKCRKSAENAKSHESKVKQIEQESVHLNSEADKMEKIEDVKKIKDQIKDKVQAVVKGNEDINKELTELKDLHELVLSTNYKSIIDFIRKNVSDAKKCNTSVSLGLVNSSNTNETVRVNFIRAGEFKDKINKHLEDKDMDDLIKNIVAIKDEFLIEKNKAMTYLSDAEKNKGICSLNVDNVKKGKEKIVYLKDNDKGRTTIISDLEMSLVEHNMNNVNQYCNEVDQNTKQIKDLYDSILQYEVMMDNLFKESYLKREKGKCERRENKLGDIMKQINLIDSNIKEQLEKYEKKISEMKEQSNIEKKSGEVLNELCTKSFLDIQNCRQELDNVLGIIQTVKNNVTEHLNNANASIKSVPSISQLNNLNSLKELEKAKENYENKLQAVLNVQKRMNEIKVSLHEIDTKITNVDTDLEKHKKGYEVGLMQDVKKKAEKRMTNFELIKSEIKSLINTSTSIFAKSNLENYDVTKYLKDYGTKLSSIEEEFNKSYQLIHINESKIVNSSVKYNDAKNLRRESEMEEEKLGQKEQAEKELLENIKKVESIRLLNEMKKSLKKEDQKIISDNTKINEHIGRIRKNIDDLKETNDVNAGSSIVHTITNISKEIKSTEYIPYKNESEKMFGRMILVANDSLNDSIKIRSEVYTNLEVPSSFNSNLESDIFSIMKESHGILKNVEKMSNEIVKNKTEAERLLTETNDIFTVIKLRSDFNKKRIEMDNKEIRVIEKVQDALHKLKKIEDIRCDYKHYDKMLEEREEYQKLKSITSIYQNNKSKMIQEQVLQEMHKNMNYHKNSISDLEQIVGFSNESTSDIVKLKKCNDDIENISKNIDTIDNDITEILLYFDELLHLGKSCQTQWIHLISSIVNTKNSKYAIMIKKQKENTKNTSNYVVENAALVNEYIDELNGFYNNDLTIKNTSSNVKRVSEYSKNFYTHEEEAMKFIRGIKQGLYSLNEHSDINDVEKTLEKMITSYNSLKNEKLEMDKIYLNMNETRLNEIEHSCVVFNPVMELHKNKVETKRKNLLEREKQLIVIYDNIKRHEIELVKISLKYTPESVKNVNEVYKNIELEMRTLEGIQDNSSYIYADVETYKEHIMSLIQRIDNLLSDVEIFRKENNYNLMEIDAEIIRKISSYIDRIITKLNNAKSEYQKLLNDILQNENILSRVVYKRDDVYRIYEEMKKKNERLLKDLSEQDKLLKIKEKLDNIHVRITEKIVQPRIEKTVENVSKKFDLRTRNPEDYTSIDDIDKELRDIKSDTKRITDIKMILYTVLAHTQRDKNNMDAIFRLMSNNINSSEYESAGKYIIDAANTISMLNAIITKVNNLINDNDELTKKMNVQKNKVERDNSEKELKHREDIKRKEEERENEEQRNRIEHEKNSQMRDLSSDEVTNEETVVRENLEGREIPGISDLEGHEQDEIGILHTSDDDQEDRFQGDNSTDASNSGIEQNHYSGIGIFDRINYAGGILIAMGFFSTIAYIIMGKKKRNEENEENTDLEKEDKIFDVKKSIQNQNKEEIIDVSFIESVYY